MESTHTVPAFDLRISIQGTEPEILTDAGRKFLLQVQALNSNR